MARLAVFVLVAGANVVAAVLAGARVLSPTTQRGIELTACTPLGLPAALLGVIGAVVLARHHRRAGGAMLLLALTCAPLHAWWLAPRFVGAVPEAAADGPRLVVMVQNIEGGAVAEMVDLAEEHDVDVLVLADATDEQAAMLERSSLAHQLSHTTLGNGRGSVVWSRYPITSDTLVTALGESRKVGLDVPGLAEVVLVAVHPTPPYVADGAQWHADWDQALAEVEQARRDATTGRVLVVGDLNATPDHWPLRTLGRWGFRDSAEQLNDGLAGTWPANGSQVRFGISVPPVLALDHVLTGSGLVTTHQVVSSAVGGDHSGVIVTLAPAAP